MQLRRMRSQQYTYMRKGKADLACHGHLCKVVVAQQVCLLLLEGQHLLNDGGVVFLPTGSPGDVGPVHLLTQRPTSSSTHSIISFNHSFIHACIRSLLVRLFNHSFLYPFIHS